MIQIFAATLFVSDSINHLMILRRSDPYVGNHPTKLTAHKPPTKAAHTLMNYSSDNQTI